MNESRFLSMIEEVREVLGGNAKFRQRLVEVKLSENRACKLQESLEAKVIPILREQLDSLPAEELLTFDRTLERELYDIDRAEIQERTAGSDDGFLYCRGFMVGKGREYYEAVRANPDIAVADAEYEEMCYLPWHLHNKKFSEVPPSGISRETRSKASGWPTEAQAEGAAEPGRSLSWLQSVLISGRFAEPGHNLAWRDGDAEGLLIGNYGSLTVTASMWHALAAVLSWPLARSRSAFGPAASLWSP